jgi:hypothetical protein
MKISKLQVVEPQHWSGLTKEAHLGYLGMLQPELISKVVDRLYEVNYGADNIVSFIDQFPVHYLNQDGIYQWLVQGSEERNIPLVKASFNTGGNQLTAVDRAGLMRSPFYMWFAERLFEISSVLVGERPEDYSLRVVEEPVADGTNWRYKVELVTGDDTLFVPYTELAVGTRWSSDFGLVEHELSVRGNSVSHASPYKMENTTSYIRKQYDVPGNMIVAGQNTPLAYAFIDDNGKQQTRWIDKLGWDFMTQFRRDKARLLLHGKSNRLADGTYGNRGETGNTIRAGFGLYEQMDGGNLMYFNTFSIDKLTDFALDITVGKFKEDSRKFVLSTGERGAYEFHKSASNKASGITWLRSGHNFEVGNGKVTLDEGQILKYRSVNGIEFNIIIDPMKDDPVRNKMLHPNGGLASSYMFDIWDFGTTNGAPNIQRVAVKGNEEIFGYIPGLRDPFTPYNNMNSPRMIVSPKDGYSVYKMFIGGIMLRNPLKTGRFIPTILRSY